MPFLREKSGKWSAEKIVAFAGRVRPRAVARVARLERRPQSGAPDQ